MGQTQLKLPKIFLFDSASLSRAFLIFKVALPFYLWPLFSTPIGKNLLS